MVTRNGNSPVTSTRQKYFSVTSVTRSVNEKTTSITLRAVLRRERRTSTAARERFSACSCATRKTPRQNPNACSGVAYRHCRRFSNPYNDYPMTPRSVGRTIRMRRRYRLADRRLASGFVNHQGIREQESRDRNTVVLKHSCQHTKMDETHNGGHAVVLSRGSQNCCVHELLTNLLGFSFAGSYSVYNPVTM